MTDAQAKYDKYNTDTLASNQAAVDQEEADQEAAYPGLLEAAIAEATKMDENTIYEVCTKIDQQGDGDIPVTIETVDPTA